MSSIKRYVRALKDKDPDVRKDAAKNLAILGNPRAVEPLINTLDDSFWDVRLFIVMALDVLADPRALEPLVKALNDEDSSVRSAAARAVPLNFCKNP